MKTDPSQVGILIEKPECIVSAKPTVYSIDFVLVFSLHFLWEFFLWIKSPSEDSWSSRGWGGGAWVKKIPETSAECIHACCGIFYEISIFLYLDCSTSDKIF